MYIDIGYIPITPAVITQETEMSVKLPRPRKPRRIGFFPTATYFKPGGGQVPEPGEIIINVDEWEALRLKDYLGLDQQVSAEHMKLAQSTFQRILNSARIKLATAIIEGKPVRITYGEHQLIGHWYCQSCGCEWEKIIEENRIKEQFCPSCGRRHQNRHRHGWGPPPWAGPGRNRR